MLKGKNKETIYSTMFSFDKDNQAIRDLENVNSPIKCAQSAKCFA